MFRRAVVVCEARLRGVEERVRGVPPARRRREAERVRHELGAVVEREARVSGEAAREVGRELALRQKTMLPRGVVVSRSSTPPRLYNLAARVCSMRKARLTELRIETRASSMNIIAVCGVSGVGFWLAREYLPTTILR